MNLLLFALLAAVAPTSLPSADAMEKIVPAQLHATQPDYVVFVPDVRGGSIAQTGNEHFLVFDGPDGSLMTIWTQSTGEGQPDQHIVFAQSTDEGKTWSKPRLIAGPARAGEANIASWAFPLVSKTGRIYVLYSQHIGKFDSFFHTTGRLDGIYSDDLGKTWSTPQTVALPRTSRDNPDQSFPSNIICWQKPQRIGADDKYFAGITRWTSKGVFKNPGKSWASHDSVVEFMRFENIDANPAVADIQIKWFAFDKDALTVPHPQFPKVSICQEPAIVKLPDGRLFCALRTITGHPYYSLSSDRGETWTRPQVLLDHDGGSPLLHPLAPSPIYDLKGNGAGSGEYFLLLHNNDGHFKNFTPEQTGENRQPVFILRGHFDKAAKQPIRFDAPAVLFDHDGTKLGAPESKGRRDLAMYDSITFRNGKCVLWYPDRKFSLLGKVIGEQPTN